MVYAQWWDKDPHGKYERRVDIGSLHMLFKQDDQKKEYRSIDAKGVYTKEGGNFAVDLARGSPQYPDIKGDQDYPSRWTERIDLPDLREGENAGYITDRNAVLRGLRTDLYIPSQPRPQPKTTPPYREIAHPATANFRPPHRKGPQGPSKQGAHNGKI